MEEMLIIEQGEPEYYYPKRSKWELKHVDLNWNG